MFTTGVKHYKAFILKKFIRSLLILLVILGGNQGLKSQNLPEKPNPPQLVNDFAGMLNPGDRASLEAKLVAFDDSTTNQIAVVTVDSLGGDDISDYAIKLFQKWKIGEAKKNNGVLILICKSTHGIWITTGYGLEPVITDALSKRFINEDIKPNFKLGKYYAGLDLATTHLMQLAKGEYHDARPMPVLAKSKGSGFLPILIIILVLIFLFTRGGGNGQVIGGSGFPFWFFLGSLMNSGRGDSWGGSGGGFGGGGGGGGFGGFGGGDTGGGGAGGSW
jgi:uncharacterized protein